ncbi:DNA-binding protein [Allostreptomyces psammosilenae]|uniref:PIN domain-containing protein n=1 Tax=Allostreptomyces psammosilenae TaxID=1892865 RepID=A0A853A5G2_9ACTN|nr:DNA-binding protein [Allostreptomyces psammosilenae]NYI05931.1 hypothetical protein [Allostreptomyces psammosilenae]
MTGTSTVLLDSEALSRAILNDRQVMALLSGARLRGMQVVVSNMTLIEAHHPRVNSARFNWVVSRLKRQPVTDEITQLATRLLRETGLHGHKYAIDAVVAATALLTPAPAVILTSDPEDMSMLCGDRARILKL